MRALILLGALALGGCSLFGRAPIVAVPSACSSLIPDAWKQPVPGFPLPNGEKIGDWIAFGDGQTGRLDVANARTADALAIIARCEARDAAAVKKSRGGLFHR